MLATRPAPFNWSMTCIRKRDESPWPSAMALIDTGCPAEKLAANSTMATQAYSALADTLTRPSGIAPRELIHFAKLCPTSNGTVPCPMSHVKCRDGTSNIGHLTSDI